MEKKESSYEEQLEDLIEEKDQKLHVPKELPVLMLRDIVVFPYMVVPLFVGREKSKNAVDQALSSHRMILLLTQKSAEVEDPKKEDVFAIGTVALIMRMLKLPDGRIRILAQGLVRAKIESLQEDKPYFTASVQVLHDPDEAEKSIEVEALVRNVRTDLDKASALGKNIPPEVMIIAANVEEPGRLADLTAANLELKVNEAQRILEVARPLFRKTEKKSMNY